MDSRSPEQNQKSFDDQRYFPRWNVQDRVFYQSAADPHMHGGWTRDLSCAGACLFLNENLAPRQKLSLKVHLSSKASVDLQGTVLWQKASDGGYLTGVSFQETSDTAQELILEHAFEVDHKKLVDHWYKGWEGKTP